MTEEIVGESGGGLIRIICDDFGRPLRVEIADEIFNKEDKQLISDLFVAAMNDSVAKAAESVTEKIIQKRGHFKIDTFLKDMLGPKR